MHRIYTATVVGFWISMSGLAAEEPAFVAEFRAVIAEAGGELQKLNAGFQREYGEAETAAQRDAALLRVTTESLRVSRPAAERILATVRPQAADPVAAEALVWVANNGGGADLAARAAELLKAHHLTRKPVVDLAYNNRRSGYPWAESLLRAQLAAADLPADQRPRVLIALAILRQAQATMPGMIAEMGEADVARMTAVFGEAGLAALRKLDVPAAEAEAVRLYEEAAAKYGPLKFAGDRIYADIAKSSIFEIRNLTVGKAAPDIAGEGIDGAKFKLSDSRGKVVLLVFWATWCPACMESIPREREIVARFRGKPFELVGVNADADRAKLKPVIEKEKITWRSFWCGEQGPAGDIPRAWNVSSWPTAYVLDANGVIRAKNVFGPALDRALDRVVTETAAPKK